MRVGLCQLPVTAELKTNHAAMRAMVLQAAAEGCDLVCLPEMWPCPYENEAFVAFAESAYGETWHWMKEAAKDAGVYLIGGSVPELDDKQLFNTCFVFDPDGQAIAKHRKVHLFDIDVPGQRFMESDTFTPGENFTVFETPFGRIGVAICFDIRFVEQFRIMALMGAKALFVPGAFNQTTGPAHWELSFRARAVDNQCFTFGCAPACDMQASYHSYGHSIVCDPWGRAIRQLDDSPGLLVQDIDLDEVDRLRNQLPILKNRRTDLYQVNFENQE